MKPQLTFKGKEFKIGGNTIPIYIPSEETIQAVNLAIMLERPLLVVGEDGSGMRVLPKAIAHDLYEDEENFEDFYFEWFLKSTTTLKEGLYQYDAIERLRDAQLMKLNSLPKSPEDYVNYGKVGQSLKKSESGFPSILWVDRINRVGPFFLDELLETIYVEQGIFMPEIGFTISYDTPPILIITADSIEDLPNETLRKFIYLHHTFPGKPNLQRIAKTKFPTINIEIINQAVDKFLELRDLKEGSKPGVKELIDWLSVFKYNLEKSKGSLVDQKAILDSIFKGIFSVNERAIAIAARKEEKISLAVPKEVDNDQLKQELMQYVGNDEIKKVFSELNELSNTLLHEYQNEIIVLANSYNALKKKEIQNTISLDNFNIEKNKILISLITIIKEL